MENLTTLLQELAAKLGTTTEYLWGILIRQAHIAAIQNLVFICFVILFGISLIFLNKYYSKERGERKMCLYDSEEIPIIIMAVCIVVFAILFIAATCCVSPMINGFLNPEYWALQDVLFSIRGN